MKNLNQIISGSSLNAAICTTFGRSLVMALVFVGGIFQPYFSQSQTSCNDCDPASSFNVRLGDIASNSAAGVSLAGGRSIDVSGEFSLAYGEMQDVAGEYNYAFGHDNEILANSSRNFTSGEGNFINEEAVFNKVFGREITIGERVQHSYAFGRNHDLLDGTTPRFYFGEELTVLDEREFQVGWGDVSFYVEEEAAGVNTTNIGPPQSPDIALQVEEGNFIQSVDNNFGLGDQWNALGEAPDGADNDIFGLRSQSNNKTLYSGVLDDNGTFLPTITWEGDENFVMNYIDGNNDLNQFMEVDRNTGDFIFAERLLPEDDEAQDIGSSNDSWQDIYGQNFLSASDQNKKTNINELEYGLEDLLELSPVYYNWKEGNTDEVRLGLIAQEVREVIEEVVHEGDEGNLFMSYKDLIPVLIQAMQEQQEAMEEKEERVETLENEVDELRQEMTMLRQEVYGDEGPEEGGASGDRYDDMQEATLEPNTPNPFTEETEIAYTLPENVGLATIEIYDMNGKQIKSIDAGNTAGSGSATISGRELNPGIYVYTLIVDGEATESHRMILSDE